MAETQDAYVKRLEAEIARWSAEIDKLKAQAEKAEAEAELEYEDRLKELRERRDDARARAVALAEATAGAWEELKKGAGDAVDTLKSSVEEARREFG